MIGVRGGRTVQSVTVVKINLMKCYKNVNDKIGDIFAWYGRQVSRRPWTFIIICVVTNVLLGIGLLRLDIENNTEKLFTPEDSQAYNNREQAFNLFPENSDNDFFLHNSLDLGYYASVIIKPQVVDVLSEDFMKEVESIYNYIKETKVTHNGQNVKYEDICAKRESKCVVNGDEFLNPSVKDQLLLKNISYPRYGLVHLPTIFSKAKEENGFLVSADAYTLRFNLFRSDKELVRKWLEQFVVGMENLITNQTEVAYEHAFSLDEELNANIAGDVSLFSITFTLMCTYASLATVRGDCLADRSALGFGGVLATVLAILGAFGLCSACGVKFVNIVGVAPFLVVGIGVDDMFILLSGMAEAMEHETDKKGRNAGKTGTSGKGDTTETDKEGGTPGKTGTSGKGDTTDTDKEGGTPGKTGTSGKEDTSDTDIEERTARMMRTSGLGITITSLTDLIGFLIGSASIFPAVQYFCIYTGVSILFCYMNHVTFFASCIVIDQRRIAAQRHSKTCMSIKLKNDIEADGASKASIYCCSGKIPRKREDVESPLESYPRRMFTFLSLCNPLKPFILLALLGYWGISIWGAIFFEEGLLLENLVHTESYYYKYSVWNREYYDSEIVVMFVVNEQLDYTSADVRKHIQDLLDNAKQNKYIDNDFQLSWLKAYSDFPNFDASTKETFAQNLKLFLNEASGKIYTGDVTFADDASVEIKACRVYVRSLPTDDSESQSNIMVETRDIAQASTLSVFAYAPGFIFFEQFLSILPQTMQTLGVVAASIFVVTLIFMPHPFIVILVVVAVGSMMTGLIGFMYFWSLTLSSITMIHIIMSIGFSVDYSAHICHAFMIADGETRADKVRSAMNHAGGPVFSGAFSSFIGIIVLFFSSSYIFQSFFKVMLIVIITGTAHALLFLPVIMSMIGPLSSRSSNTAVSPIPSKILLLGDFKIPRPAIKPGCTHISIGESGIDESQQNISYIKS